MSFIIWDLLAGENLRVSSSNLGYTSSLGYMARL